MLICVQWHDFHYKTSQKKPQNILRGGLQKKALYKIYIVHTNEIEKKLYSNNHANNCKIHNISKVMK